MQNPYLYTGEARSAQRGGFLGMLSDLLGGAKSWMNAPGTLPAGVPLVGGQGLGDLVMGQAPEYLDDRSYGLGGARNGGADPRLMDLAMLLAPGAGRAAGVARALPGVARQAALDAYGPAVHMARPRYTLGGRDVDRVAVQRELGLAPPVDEIKRAMQEAKNMRARIRYADKKNRATNLWNQESTADRRYELGDKVLTGDELLKAILERGKSLPQTPQGPVPLPWTSRGVAPKYRGE